MILEQAVRVASTVGIEGLSIGELARTVGMSKSGLFAHFKSKDQLQQEALQTAVDQFVEDVLKPAFKQPRGEPRLKAMVDNWVNHIDDESTLPGGSVLISASIELDDRPGPLREFVCEAQESLIENIRTATRLAVSEKHFRSDLDIDLFAWSLYSFVLGYHHFSRLLKDPRSKEHFKRAVKGLMELAKNPNGGK
jgi:AcrR family transcriptional regulator